MTVPTPRSAAPTHVLRLAAVADAMAEVGDLHELTTAEAIDRLNTAQRALADALNPDGGQRGLPGMDRHLP